jgi:hypothetical protein
MEMGTARAKVMVTKKELAEAQRLVRIQGQEAGAGKSRGQ